MQERKNKLRFLLLAALTVATLLLLWWVQPENRLDVDQNIFQVADLTTISQVKLEGDSSVVALSYDGGRWRVNDLYNADRNMISVLFATLQQVRPKRAVGIAQQDSIFRNLTRSGVKVSLYEGSELRKEFWAGGNRAKTQAFFGDPATQHVYVVTIPGYRVYAAGILELKESGWRDKFVFEFNWRNFKSLEADFPDKPSENFKVSKGKDFFGIEGLPEADTARLNTFLDDLSLLRVEEYITEPRLTDSLQEINPRVEFTVMDIGNRAYRLRLYSTGSSRQSPGLIQESQLALFESRKIQSLLKSRSFFRKK
jgi:hypothetical protein